MKLEFGFFKNNGRSPRSGSNGVVALIIIITIIIASLTATYSLGDHSSPRASGNSCAGPTCHPRIGTDNYDEFVNIDSYYIPSKLLLGNSTKVYVNVSITSTTYTASNTDYRCDLIVTLTSTNFKVGIQGSPKQEFIIYPGFIGNYNFTISGDVYGDDTLKLDAKITTGHGAGIANESVMAGIEIFTIVPNRPPQLLDAKVSPPSGDIETIFTYSVKYQDPDGDFPINIYLYINAGSAITISPLDGIADTIISGELYGLTRKGSDLGLGDDHTFRFAAFDGERDAVGDIQIHPGPEVVEKITPNNIPNIAIGYPTGGIVMGTVNVTGSASDPDAVDQIGLVEVRLDNGNWNFANGGELWYIHWDFTQVFPGKHIIYARASDGKDYSDVVWVEISVVQVAPERPSTAILEVIDLGSDLKKVNGTSTTPPDSDEPVELVETLIEGGTWTAADAVGPIGDNGLRTYDQWIWYLDTTALSPGFYTVSARAWMGEVVSDPVSVTITVVRRNQAPIINSTRPGKNTVVYEGAELEFVVNVTEPEGEQISYTWQLDGTNLSVPTTLNSYRFIADYQSSGFYIIEVIISDGNSDNGTVYWRWNLTVLEGLLIEDQTDLDDNVLDSEETVEFSVLVLDPEGGRLTYEWFVDGEQEPGVFGTSYKYFHEASGPNSTYHTITLVVTNEHNIQNYCSWAVQVIGKPPVVSEDQQADQEEAAETRKEMKEEGNLVIGIMAVLVILSSIFLVYSVMRKRRPKTEIMAVQEAGQRPGQDITVGKGPGLYPSARADTGYAPSIPLPIGYPAQAPEAIVPMYYERHGYAQQHPPLQAPLQFIPPPPPSQPQQPPLVPLTSSRLPPPPPPTPHDHGYQIYPAQPYYQTQPLPQPIDRESRQQFRPDDDDGGIY